MKNWFVILPTAALIATLTIISCKTANNDTSTLPKDIAERPVDVSSQKYDEAALDKIKSGIESEIAKEKCTDAADWAFAPIGSKACGGPMSYIAYPKKHETSILSKIENYTQKMSEYNKKYSITSDCMMSPEPTSVKCDNGKAVLVYAGM